MAGGRAELLDASASEEDWLATFNAVLANTKLKPAAASERHKQQAASVDPLPPAVLQADGRPAPAPAGLVGLLGDALLPLAEGGLRAGKLDSILRLKRARQAQKWASNSLLPEVINLSCWRVISKSFVYTETC